MANVAKLMDLIFGSNPSEGDLREIIKRIEAKLPPAEIVDPPKVEAPVIEAPLLDDLPLEFGVATEELPPDPPKRGKK